MTPLPTIEQAREAHRLINLGREAIGMPTLRYLDFDGAEPMNCFNCLSARNLFREAGYAVASRRLLCHSIQHAPRPEALITMGMTDERIPDAIFAVTDAFDEQVPGLRERLVEAGVVKP